jgi:glycosyl transferase family 87
VDTGHDTRDTRGDAEPSLRIGSERVRLYGVGLFLIGLAQLRVVASEGRFWDWADFQIAGLTVGTRALLDPVARAAWGAAHNVATTAFAYMPGYAWLLYAPARAPIAWGFAINAVAMLAVCWGAAIVASRVYGLERRFALLAILAWAPTTAAILTGQNSPIGLLLWLLATQALVKGRQAEAGLFAGLLLYKPTYAIPLGLVLLLRGNWRAIGSAALCGILWYAVSAAAAGGDWLWPVMYLKSMSGYVGTDFAYNAPKAVSLPGLLMRAGVESNVAFLSGMVLLVLAAWRVRRWPIVEAMSAMAVVAVATSPHAWPYDAVLVTPALLWLMTRGEEPRRTRWIVGSYALAPAWLLSHVLKVDLLAGPVLALAGLSLKGARDGDRERD